MSSAGTSNSSQRGRSSVSGLNRLTLMVSVIVGAFPPGRRFGFVGVSASAARSAAVGAVVWAALTGDPGPLAGAFPGVYGLIGAYTFLMWTNLAALGSRRIEAFRLIAVLLAIQLLFGLLLGGRSDWIADVAGFAAGFALSVVVSPGGLAALRDRLRRR